MDNTVTIKQKLLTLTAVNNVPEIKLYLTDKPHTRENPTDRFECWPFAWIGGQALARYILDNPEIVAGKTVVDLASGSGIVAIAAKMAGAARVIALDDYDPCIECIKLNAEANGVEVETLQQDIFSYSPEGVDLFLFGDPFFDSRVLPHVKVCFKRTLVGCPIRFPHYQLYMNMPIQTYHMRPAFNFDDAMEFDVHIWWLND